MKYPLSNKLPRVKLCKSCGKVTPCKDLLKPLPRDKKKCKPLGIVTPSKLWLKLLQKSESASFGAKSCPLSVCWSYHQTTKLANPLANPHQLGFGWSGKLRGKVTPSKRWLNVPPKDKLCKPFAIQHQLSFGWSCSQKSDFANFVAKSAI